MKLNLFLLLTASAIVATCFSVVSAGSTNGDLVALTFEPPLAFTSYPGAGCSPGDDGTSYPGHVTDIQMISYGQFCITDLVVDDSGDETTTTTTTTTPTPTTTPMVNAYTLIDQVTCTPWGIFERYSTCTDATCSDCLEPEAVAVSSWDEVDTDVYEGQCFDYTYSFDPTSFIGDLYPVGFSFDEGANMDDVAAYLELFNANSCVADGQYGSSSNSNSAPVTNDDDNDDLSECQSIRKLQLVCWCFVESIGLYFFSARQLCFMNCRNGCMHAFMHAFMHAWRLVVLLLSIAPAAITERMNNPLILFLLIVSCRISFVRSIHSFIKTLLLLLRMAE